MIVDNHVIKVERGTWQIDDDRACVQGATLVGRAEVRVDGDRYCIDAVVVSSTDRRTLGQKYAVFFDPESSRLVALPMEAT